MSGLPLGGGAVRCGRPTRPTLFAADGARGDGGALVAAPRTATVAVPLHSGHAERLAVRRLARQLPAALAAQRRRRLRQAAQRAGQTPRQARLARAEWDAASTTGGPERLTVEEGVVLARVRWQIAPLCKLWQQHGLVAAWRRAQPWRMRGAGKKQEVVPVDAFLAQLTEEIRTHALPASSAEVSP